MPLMFVVMTQETTTLIYLWMRYKHSCLNDKKHSMLTYCFCLPFPWSLLPEPRVSKASKCPNIGSKSQVVPHTLNLASKKEILFCCACLQKLHCTFKAGAARLQKALHNHIPIHIALTTWSCNTRSLFTARHLDTKSTFQRHQLSIRNLSLPSLLKFPQLFA